MGRAAHRGLMHGFREGLRQARGEGGEVIADLEEKDDVLLEEAERQDVAALPVGMRATRAFTPEEPPE